MIRSNDHWEESIARPETTGKASIICIDDDPLVLSALRRTFRGEPYDVWTTQRPSEALERLEYRPQSLLITDQRMPEMSGVDLIQIVKERFPSAIRVMLTGSPDDAALNDRNRGIIEELIPKPWRDQELKETVSHLLSRRAIRHATAVGKDKGSVLIVTPSDPSMGDIEDCLTGFDVLVALDPYEARAFARWSRNRLDMVLVDARFYSTAIPSLVADLRHEVPGLYVVTVGGNASREWLTEVYRAGASVHVEWPWAARYLTSLNNSLPLARRRKKQGEHARRRTTGTPPRRLYYWLRSALRLSPFNPEGRTGRIVLSSAAGLFAGIILAFLMSQGFATFDWMNSRLDRALAAFERPLVPDSSKEREFSQWLSLQQLEMERQRIDHERSYQDRMIDINRHRSMPHQQDGYSDTYAKPSRVEDGGPQTRTRNYGNPAR